MPDLKLHPLFVTTTYTSFVLTDASEGMNKVNDASIFSLHSTIEWTNMWKSDYPPKPKTGYLNHI